MLRSTPPRTGCLHALRQEKSLASQSWEESRLGTLDSGDLPAGSHAPAFELSNGNGNHAANGNGNGSTAAEHREEERRKLGEALATASLETESVDEMWQAGGEAAAHDAPAATAKKAI